VGSTRWTPSSGAHSPVRRTTVDSTVVRTAMVRHRVRYRTTPTMSGTLARPGAPHPALRTGVPPVGCGRTRATPLSGSATATFLLAIAGFGWRAGPGQGGV
jgi:hypothetical protein